MRKFIRANLTLSILLVFLMHSCVKNTDEINREATANKESKEFKTKADKLAEVVFNTGMVGYPETLTDEGAPVRDHPAIACSGCGVVSH